RSCRAVAERRASTSTAKSREGGHEGWLGVAWGGCFGLAVGWDRFAENGVLFWYVQPYERVDMLDAFLVCATVRGCFSGMLNHMRGLTCRCVSGMCNHVRGWACPAGVSVKIAMGVLICMVCVSHYGRFCLWQQCSCGIEHRSLYCRSALPRRQNLFVRRKGRNVFRFIDQACTK
ncbi:unnamed protein product, partial [Ectocarpus sp. 8 AP-2014]